jgi:integrase
MLLVTGQRREEVAGMRWSELDRELREWTIPGERTKNSKTHVVPLSSLAVRLIDVLAASQAWPAKGPVFTTRGDVPISGFSKIKKQLDASMCREAAHRELSPWRMHDLRRTLATGLQRLGVRFEVIEAILNHVSGSKSGIAGVYQRHEWASEKREALERWGAKLENLVCNAETRISARS